MSGYVRVNVIVEGHTEETFVRDLLTPSFAVRGVSLRARRIETSRTAAHIYRGGMTTYAKAKRDIQRWLQQDVSAYLTTMFDLYRLPPDFPGIDAISSLMPPYEKTAHLEQALAEDMGSRRFVPYIQLHEFEGLLFSDIQAIDAVLRPYHTSRLSQLQAIRESFKTPELIDEGETTAPSKRLITLYPGYNKLVFGFRIASRIGLTCLRRECPHFAAWLTTLQSLEGLE